MKKIYYSVVVLVLLSIALFTGCKKVNEGPFPTAPNAGGTFNDLAYITPNFPVVSDAYGVLIAVQAHDQKTVVVTPFQNNYEYGMAEFTNSPGSFNSSGSFSSLITASSLSINNIGITPSNANSYLSPASNYTIGFSGGVTWQIGTGVVPVFSGSSVQPFNYSLNGVFPLFTDSFQNWADNWLPIYPRALPVVPPRPCNVTYLCPQPTTWPHAAWTADSAIYYGPLAAAIQTYLSDSTTYANNFAYNKTPQWVVPIKGSVYNADTVFIILNDFNGFLYQTKVAANVDSVAFTPNTFSVSPSSYNVSTLTMQINAVKYRDTVLSGKKFYFLKMGSYIKYYGATK